MRPVTFLVAVLAVAPFSSVTAQEPTAVEPGKRVRVTYREPCPPNTHCVGTRPDATYMATVVSWTRDTLLLDIGRVPIDVITKLEVIRGWKLRTGDGAIIGAAFMGGLMSLAAAGACGQLSCSAGEVVRKIGYAAAIGAGIGAFIGSAFTGDRWEEVPLDQLRVSFAPQRDGRLGLGLSVRF